jgi:flagellar protein FliO/FliZ
MTCSRSFHAIVAAVACALLTAPAALAATSTSTTPTGENTPLRLDPTPAVQHSSGTGGGMVRTIVGLAVVIGVIVGLHWVLKQVKSSRESHSTGGGLQPLSTLALGPGRSLHLVRAGNEIVLVGSAEHGVTPVRVYTEEEAHALGLFAESGGERRVDLDLDLNLNLDGDGGHGPLNAGSSPVLRDVVRRIKRWTVRG